jgi:CheY-like chemotaxis protein
MIVDDDPLILEFTANLLQPWGLQVTCLENPLEFWQILTATQPDLLILDWEMPTFKGIELCQVIRNDPQWMELPILMITAHHDTDLISQAFAAGCDDFVRKPIIEPELIARILKHLQPNSIR